MGKRLNKVGGSIKKFFSNITAPLRKSRGWKFLRRTVLRSPFRGYFVNSWHELRKVEWPDRKTSWKLTATVIVFSTAFAILTTTLDYGFEKLAKQIFLK